MNPLKAAPRSSQKEVPADKHGITEGENAQDARSGGEGTVFAGQARTGRKGRRHNGFWGSISKDLGFCRAW